MSLLMFCMGVFKQAHAQRDPNGLLKALVNPKGSSKDCSFSDFEKSDGMLPTNQSSCRELPKAPHYNNNSVSRCSLLPAT